MNISEKLRKLALSVQNNADLVLQSAENSEAYQLVVDSIAASIDTLESTATMLEEEGLDSAITEHDLDAMVAVAEEFDKSGDPLLMKQASVMDEILRTFGAPYGEVARIKAQAEAEIERLREKYRSEKLDELYGPKSNVREALNKQNNVDKVRSAVQSQIKQYRPLEASLSTRYPPDMPGGHLVRISDSIYQDVLTGKIYDYKNGYTTAKGNKVPGTAVEYQIPDVGSLSVGDAIFETRQSVMSKAAERNDELIKQAQLHSAGKAYMKAVVDLAPPEAEEYAKALCETSDITCFKSSAVPWQEEDTSVILISAPDVEKLADFAKDHPVRFGWIYPDVGARIPVGTDQKFIDWARSESQAAKY